MTPFSQAALVPLCKDYKRIEIVLVDDVNYKEPPLVAKLKVLQRKAPKY
jgi:hypothetical protein